MYFQQGFNREQLIMFDFELMVSINSWVGVVDLFVGVLPLKELGFNDVLADEVRPPFRLNNQF